MKTSEHLSLIASTTFFQLSLFQCLRRHVVAGQITTIGFDLSRSFKRMLTLSTVSLLVGGSVNFTSSVPSSPKYFAYHICWNIACVEKFGFGAASITSFPPRLENSRPYLKQIRLFAPQSFIQIILLNII